MELHRLTADELRSICRQTIESLEFWLRRLIDETLTEAYGPDYWDWKRSDDSNLIKTEIKNKVVSRRNNDPARFSRIIDATQLDDEINIICNPRLFADHFIKALKFTFPEGNDGVKMLRIILDRIFDARNPLSHGNPISIRQAEQIICYSHDIIDSLKQYYQEENKNMDYNVPRIIQASDSLGNSVFAQQMSRCSGFCGLFWALDRDTKNYLYPSDRLSIEVEVDPAFSDNTYSIEWNTTGARRHACKGKRFELEISEQDVGENFEIHCSIKSNKEWHRFNGYDDGLIIRYKVLPPII